MKERPPVLIGLIALNLVFYASQLFAQDSVKVAQVAPPTTAVPDWLAGKFTGTQTVTSRPTWAPAPIEIDIAKSGTWELNLGGVPGPATVQGTVTSITESTAILSGRYTAGRNFGKQVTYKLSLGGGKIKGAVEADWITMPIAVELNR